MSRVGTKLYVLRVCERPPASRRNTRVFELWSGRFLVAVPLAKPAGLKQGLVARIAEGRMPRSRSCLSFLA